jgi:hypothetical protein
MNPFNGLNQNAQWLDLQLLLGCDHLNESRSVNHRHAFPTLGAGFQTRGAMRWPTPHVNSQNGLLDGGKRSVSA